MSSKRRKLHVKTSHFTNEVTLRLIGLHVALYTVCLDIVQTIQYVFV